MKQRGWMSSNFDIMKKAARQLLMMFCLCLLQAHFSSCNQAELIEGPVTQIVPLTQTTVQFTCRGRGTAIFWYINDVILFNNQAMFPCISRTYRDEANHSTGIVTKRIDFRTQPLSLNCNQTRIRCHITADGPTVDSPTAYMYIADVPSTPNTQVELYNTTTLLISWVQPFSMEQFPIHTYTLTISNASSTILVYSGFAANESSFQYFYTRDGVAVECNETIAQVTASSDVGTSAPGSASYVLPIVLGEFIQPVMAEVVFTNTLMPNLRVFFTPPVVCQSQTALYRLIISTDSGLLVFDIEEGSYDSTTAIIDYTMNVPRETNFEAVVIVSSITGAVNSSTQFNTRLNIFPQDIPQLVILNLTSISAQWNRSSSFDPGVDISYTLVIRDEQQQLNLHELTFNTAADFSSYPLSHVFSDAETSDCYNISFTVLSQSSGGVHGNPASAVAGLPIGLTGFSSSLDISITPATTTKVNATISFEYPPMCWYQSGTYLIEILSNDSVVATVGPVSLTGSDNTLIIETLPLCRDSVFEVVVTIESVGQQVQERSFFQTTVELSSTNQEIEVLVGVILGVALFILLIVAIAVIVILLCYLKNSSKNANMSKELEVVNPLSTATSSPVCEDIEGKKKDPLFEEIKGNTNSKTPMN